MWKMHHRAQGVPDHKVLPVGGAQRPLKARLTSEESAGGGGGGLCTKNGPNLIFLKIVFSHDGHFGLVGEGPGGGGAPPMNVGRSNVRLLKAPLWGALGARGP